MHNILSLQFCQYILYFRLLDLAQSMLTKFWKTSYSVQNILIKKFCDRWSNTFTSYCMHSIGYRSMQWQGVFAATSAEISFSYATRFLLILNFFHSIRPVCFSYYRNLLQCTMRNIRKVSVFKHDVSVYPRSCSSSLVHT